MDPDRSIRNTIFVLRRIIKRSIENQYDVYASFIDYSKTFDTVKHNVAINNKDTYVLTNLC